MPDIRLESSSDGPRPPLSPATVAPLNVPGAEHNIHLHVAETPPDVNASLYLRPDPRTPREL